MRIAFIGPSMLTKFDEIEIKDYFTKTILEDNEISILVYNSIENFLLKLFFELATPEQFTKLNIYAFQTFDFLPSKIKLPVQFALEYGANFYTAGYEPSVENYRVNRELFTSFWKKIMQDCDAVVSFYDQVQSPLLVPINVAKELNKKGVIFYLSKHNKDNFHREWYDKIRIV